MCYVCVRFWKQGYWRNHLAGRKYHISALFVVDLKKFRRIAAGDRLRGQYQGLSQDPNSLSNLDQVSHKAVKKNNIDIYFTHSCIKALVFLCLLLVINGYICSSFQWAER